MSLMRPTLIAIVGVMLAGGDVLARSRAPVRKFYKLAACPSTMQIAPPCPGYVVDHVMPLCSGGADDPSNMQWQEKAESLQKDRIEIAFCRWLRKAGR